MHFARFGRLGVLGLILLSSCSDDSEQCGADGACNAGGTAADGGNGIGGGNNGGTPAEGGAPAAGSDQGGAGGEAPTKVHVTVVDFSENMPIIDFDVISNDADGAVVDQGVTGVDGAVDLDVPSGGSVSVLALIPYPEVSQDYVERHMKTFFFDGPPPSEARFRLSLSSAYPQDTMNVTVSYPPRSGAASYRVSATCAPANNTPSTSSTLLARDCAKDGLFDVLVVALNAAAVPIDYGWVTDKQFVAGGSGSFNVSWSGGAVSPVHMSVTNIPTNSPTLSMGGSDALRRDWGVAYYNESATFDQPDGEYSHDFSHLSTFGVEHCEFVTVRMSLDLETAVRSTCSAVAHDLVAFDASRLSRLRPSFAVDGPLRMQLTETWPGDYGDFVATYVMASDGTTGISWDSYARATANAELRFPDVPDSLSDFTVSPDQVQDYGVSNVDVDEYASFAQAIAEGLPVDQNYSAASFHVEN